MSVTVFVTQARFSLPGGSPWVELLRFLVRRAIRAIWRATQGVVDSKLRVYGVKNLRIADGSIMTAITTGNTQAPCVIIGERLAEVLKCA
jgi:choline dehydrogenase